jgi:hypothetical protein
MEQTGQTIEARSKGKGKRESSGSFLQHTSRVIKTKVKDWRTGSAKSSLFRPQWFAKKGFPWFLIFSKRAK